MTCRPNIFDLFCAPLEAWVVWLCYRGKGLWMKLSPLEGVRWDSATTIFNICCFNLVCYVTHTLSLSLSLSVCLAHVQTHTHTHTRAQHVHTHTSRASWLGDASALMLMRQKLFLALGEKFKLFSVSDDCKVSFDLFSHLSHFHFSLNDLFFVWNFWKECFGFRNRSQVWVRVQLN